MSKVLVTGGSGFIAGHIIKQLLERGYNVVTTVRSPEKGASVLSAHSTNGTQPNLNYQIVEDVAQIGAFDEAIKTTPNLDYVIHTTSPFHYNVENPVKDFLEPAVNGTTSILRAIKDNAPSVKRVVLLSSLAAIRNPAKEGSGQTPPIYEESSWNPVTWDEAATDGKKTYQGSKTLSERAAWSFMTEESPTFDLTTINPALVFGPPSPTLPSLSALNTSNVRILDMLQGKMSSELAPTGFYTWADVRDVAYAHVRALEVPEAGGQRFLMIEGYYSNQQVARVVAGVEGGKYREKLPENVDELKDDIPGEGERYGFDTKRSRDILGVTYRSLEESVRDTVEALVKLGA